MEVIERSQHIDWVTATLPAATNLQEWGRWRNAIEHTADLEAHTDERIKWQWLGYSGWVQGSVRFGQRDDGELLMVSGQAANSACDLVAGVACRPSRLDVALDVRMADDDPGLARRLAAAASVSRETGYAPEKWKITTVEGWGDGDTVYLGSRKSERFLRVYDKWRESGNDLYKHVWRFELEVKGRTAEAFWKLWTVSDDREGLEQAVVAGYLSAHGLAGFRGYVVQAGATTPDAARAFIHGEELGMVD